MIKPSYFSGEAVSPDDLLTGQSFLEEKLDTNMSVIGNKGVFVGGQTPTGTLLGSPYVWTDTESVGIYGLIAYDSFGRLIYVEPKFNTDGSRAPVVSNLTPNSDGKLVEGGTSSFGFDKEYYMVIRYNEVYDETSKKPVNGGKNKGTLVPSRIIPSFDLYIRNSKSDLLSGDVVLALLKTDSGGIVSVDESYRDVFGISVDLLRASVSSGNLGSNITFEDHINMVGSGTVSTINPHGLSAEDLGIDISATGKHQLYLHSDGIKTDNISSTVSALCPSYSSSSLTSEEKVYVEPLLESSNEIVVVNGVTITPTNIGTRYVLDMLNYSSEEYEGYYIIVVNSESKSISLLGPYESDTTENFLNVLEDRSVFPICSFHWGRPYYAYYTLTLQDMAENTEKVVANVPPTRKFIDCSNPPDGTLTVSELVIKTEDPTTHAFSGSIIRLEESGPQYWVISKDIQVDDKDRYDIDPLTFKDRRVFNNTGIKDIRREDISAIRDSAPMFNGSTTLYYARVESSAQLSYFQVGGKTLNLTIDGYPFMYTFMGVNELSVDQLLSQLNGELQTQIPSTVKPKAFINHDKHLTIVSSKSISVISGSANTALGFVEMYDSGEDIKSIITSGDIESIQEMYYDQNDDLTDVFYITSGNYIRSHHIEYSGDFVSSVNESVEVY